MTEKGRNAAAAADLMSASLERLVDSRRADHGQQRMYSQFLRMSGPTQTGLR
jgi:hypothetical protein